MYSNNITVDNAIIMAAGFSSRFAPLSKIKPKSLWPVQGEVLIERQIRQLQEAGISDIYIVTGYKKELFVYLEEKYGVHLVENPEYQVRNNHSSIYAVKNLLKNSYICSSDNYFTENVFSKAEPHAYYSAVYASGATDEYCLTTSEEGRIVSVRIGGADSWYMLGHVFWDENFSRHFISVLEKEYNLVQTKNLLWEQIYMNHIDEFDLKIKRFKEQIILEFDTVEELAAFDPSYRNLHLHE